jgi:hypothetical protein
VATMKNNIKNIQHNLSNNICYLYEILRNDENPQCITLEFEKDGTPVKVLKKKLQDYFLNQTWETIDTSPLSHLDFDENEARFRSLSAFRRIFSVGISSKDNTVSIGYSFLTSSKRAEEALQLLTDKKIKEFELQYPEVTEINTYLETDCLMVILASLETLLHLKEQE